MKNAVEKEDKEEELLTPRANVLRRKKLDKNAMSREECHTCTKYNNLMQHALRLEKEIAEGKMSLYYPEIVQHMQTHQFIKEKGEAKIKHRIKEHVKENEKNFKEIATKIEAKKILCVLKRNEDKRKLCKCNRILNCNR